ncbi:MAG: tRNA (guanosine(46)-N7)-methyltransferase TrmB [Candidatus Liberibacter ctenarytainae]|uniref:tRNA (guanine-N(7)-)-methyltransferase n=1 Tax=Candidatus Liberibacter ctenarytainae TaxID=2020335 RepID=A0A937DLV4_9HYPH|nr:tRNA (guanosine(46)-N7)-methyltransferase TrmB [Candidatus Liberibacter ctenarytainae]
MYKNRKYGPSEVFYGRRRSRSLSEYHTHLIKDHLPVWEIDCISPPPVPLNTLFPLPVNQVRMEIGFGRGEHLLRRATEMPNTGFIGIEPFINSMAQCIRGLEELKLFNVRLYHNNAIYLLDWLPNNCIDVIYLLYPDPWTKKKHLKRRFISPINLERFSRILKKDGMLYFVSDIDSYVNWTLFNFCNHCDFQWIAEESADWLTPFHDWIPTYYERKAQSAGRTATYLTFKRV